MYNEDTPLAEFEVGSKKALLVSHHRHGLYVFKLTGGGNLPKELRGIYTGLRPAEQAILQYRMSKDKKEIKTDGSKSNNKDL